MGSPNFRIQRLNPTAGGPADPAAQRAAWLQALASFHSTHPTLIKQDGPASVHRATLLGRDIAIKRRELRSFPDRLKAFTQTSRPFRQWRGAAWLAAHAFATTEPILVALESTPTGVVEWFITAWIDGPTLLSRFAAEGAHEPVMRTMAQTAGDQVGRIVALGRFNRDHKPSNLIVLAAHPKLAGPPASPFRLAIIDCVAIRPLPPTSAPREWGAARMLASLLIEPSGVGRSPPSDWMQHAADAAARVLEDQPDRASRLARHLLDRVSAILAHHGDPTPRVNPLT